MANPVIGLVIVDLVRVKEVAKEEKEAKVKTAKVAKDQNLKMPEAKVLMPAMRKPFAGSVTSVVSMVTKHQIALRPQQSALHLLVKIKFKMILRPD